LITVIFKEPYIPADNNRWTTPQLDGDKKAIENDLLLLLALAKLKNKFITETQALLHADLHSGSVMCSPEAGATYIIDPEFAFYGPMGFDTGLFIANLLLSYVSQAAHDSSGGDYADWLLEQVCVFWSTFVSVFTTLWNDSTEHTGYLFERSVFSPDDLKQAQQEWFATMLSETLAFAGCEMIRRIVGIAHVEDLESISDQELRAKCERRGLEIGKVFVKNPSQFASIEEAIAFAKKTV
jgi:5-methylthioribose kinase